MRSWKKYITGLINNSPTPNNEDNSSDAPKE
jgi:hypothetical protein